MYKYLSKRKVFIVPMTVVLLLCLLLSSIPFRTHNGIAFAADSIFYDFVNEASKASWESGAGSLPFPGSDNDSRGFALYRDKWQLEDNSTKARALETHPQWVSNGWIMGRYPELTVPADAELKVTVGFFKGATGSDGVTFEVKFEEFLGLTVAPKTYSIVSHVATYDGKLDTLTEELSSIEGKTGNFVLYVNAGQNSGQDWAAWAEAKIEVAAPPALPDLIVEDVWQADNTIRYKIKNVGEGSVVNPPGGTTPFCNVLFIDGELVAKDCVNIHEMLPGQSIDNPFDYDWEMTPPEHAIQVCADWDEVVEESNEQNNCWEGVWTMEEEKLPDLVIEEVKCDRENSRIGYVVKNVGDGVVSAGHTTVLFVGDEAVCEDIIDLELAPGEIYETWFDGYSWPECETIKVKVCADNYNQVKETDEQNNCLEKTCECVVDIIPPRMISGPTVSQTTETSVLICWETDEVSDSLIKYDSRSGKYGSVIEDSELVKQHCLSLTNLEPATTYHFVVESADSGGNKVRSRDLNFETASPPDEEKPSLAVLVPDKLSGIATISADAQDNTGVDRVVFLLDGEPVHTDYASPFEWDCDSGILDEGLHNFGTQAFDAVGNMIEDSRDAAVQNRFPVDLSPVHVRILTPERRAGVYGEVPIGVEVTHDLNDGIKSITVKVDGEIICEKPYSKGYYMEMGPGLEPIWVVTGYPKPPVYETCDWDAGIEGDGTHVIEVSAEDGHRNWGHAGMSVQIAEPEISASRPQVTREGNYFRVTLVIENTGEIDVEDLTVSDTSVGFQCLKTGWMLKKPSGGDWRGGHPIEYEVSTTSSGSSSTISTGDLGTLRPNEAIKLQYYAVPALGGGFVVGSELEVTYRAGGRGFTDYPLRRWFVSSEEINRAFLDTDYVIVTTPEALFIHYDHDEVNELLSTMAELAKKKNGVLGYLPSSTSAHTLKGLIVPGGAWYERLVGSEGGGAFDYLLIVGETEIVPSYDYPPGVEPDHGVRPLSDNYYADVNNDIAPDLIVGRIIGNNATALRKPIQASIDVYLGNGFDGNYAVVASGYEDSCAPFADVMIDVKGDLERLGITVNEIHWSAFVEHGWSLPLTNLDYDAFALGDVDGDDIDEVIIAKDEENKIYIYEPSDRSLVSQFTCEFGQHDALATGELNGNSRDGDEIVIASIDNDTLSVYGQDGDSFTLIKSRPLAFDEWDAIATGNVLSSSSGDEIVKVTKGSRYVDIYALEDISDPREPAHWIFNRKERFELRHDFTKYDGFAVGNVRTYRDPSIDVEGWKRDEIVIIRDDDQKIYIYDADGTMMATLSDLDADGKRDVRFTRYDGFAVGDVDEDGEDEMLVICDDDDKIYKYYWHCDWDNDLGDWVGKEWKKTAMYSRWLDDWFHGIRYTGSDTRHDGFAIGRVIPGENPKIAICLIRDADSGAFGVLSSTWDNADELANERLGQFGSSSSIIVISGHGNPFGASPIWSDYASSWDDFPEHPFVFAAGCTCGNYKDKDSFGEALFEHGAAVFIGSTTEAGCTKLEETARSYFEEYGDYRRMTIGEAFTLYKRETARRAGWKAWVCDWNYYGDPKFP